MPFHYNRLKSTFLFTACSKRLTISSASLFTGAPFPHNSLVTWAISYLTISLLKTSSFGLPMSSLFLAINSGLKYLSFSLLSIKFPPFTFISGFISFTDQIIICLCLLLKDGELVSLCLAHVWQILNDQDIFVEWMNKGRHFLWSLVLPFLDVIPTILF